MLIFDKVILASMVNTDLHSLVFQCNIGFWKRQKPCQKSPHHEYENITRNCAKIEESHMTSRDNKVEKMEDNAAYSIHNTTLMTMTDCEAYGVPKTHKLHNRKP